MYYLGPNIDRIRLGHPRGRTRVHFRVPSFLSLRNRVLRVLRVLPSPYSTVYSEVVGACKIMTYPTSYLSGHTRPFLFLPILQETVLYVLQYSTNEDMRMRGKMSAPAGRPPLHPRKLVAGRWTRATVVCVSIRRGDVIRHVAHLYSIIFDLLHNCHLLPAGTALARGWCARLLGLAWGEAKYKEGMVEGNH